MAPHDPLAVSHINNLQLAEEEEQKGNIDNAIQYYESAIKDERADELPYNRLMILYRKEKRYKDELRVINKGIKVFTDFYKKATANRRAGKKLSALSEAFMMSAGLKDKKGELLYQPEPIGRWTKRREMLEKKAQGPRNKARPTRSSGRAQAKVQGSRLKKEPGSRGQGNSRNKASRTKTVAKSNRKAKRGSK